MLKPKKIKDKSVVLTMFYKYFIIFLNTIVFFSIFFILNLLVIVKFWKTSKKSGRKIKKVLQLRRVSKHINRIR